MSVPSTRPVALDYARRMLPPGVLAALRRLNQLRWITKYGNLRAAGRPLLADRMLGLRHVLLDPEIESYTYDLANEAELAEQLAEIFSLPTSQVIGYIEETHREPELNRELQRRIRWRFATKRRLPLGNRALWYAIVRIVKPRLVVETGVLSGLGSLALLCALERNAGEGHEGRLISADSDPTAGWLVPARLQTRWSKLAGFSTDVLPAALDGQTIGVFIQDSLHTPENQEAEFSLAMAHAGDPLVLVDGGGGQTPALEDICRAHGTERRILQPRPVRHIYPPSATDVAVIRAVSAS